MNSTHLSALRPSQVGPFLPRDMALRFVWTDHQPRIPHGLDSSATRPERRPRRRLQGVAAHRCPAVPENFTAGSSTASSGSFIRTGSPRRDQLRPTCGPWPTVCERFNRWIKNGTRGRYHALGRSRGGLGSKIQRVAWDKGESLRQTHRSNRRLGIVSMIPTKAHENRFRVSMRSKIAAKW